MAEREGFTQSSEFNHLTTNNRTPSPVTNQEVTAQVYTLKQQGIDDVIGHGKPETVNPETGFISPLDRPLLATRFYDQKASVQKPFEFSLRTLRKQIIKQVAETKSDLQWLKLGRFGDKRTDKNCLRHDLNLESISGVEGDYDGGLMPMGVAAAKLKEAGLAALLYESPSSTADKPRWRVLCPCSATLDPQKREPLVGRLNGVLGGVLDNVSFNLSQAYFFGNIEGKPTIETILVDGRFIDLAHDLEAAAIGRRGKVDEVSGERENDESRSGAAFKEAMAIYLRGGTVDEFQIWASDNPWKDYENNPARAVYRTWARAIKQCKDDGLEPVKFDSEGIDPDAKHQGLNVTRFADIEPENIDWVWPQRLASGKITILAGDPGQGKSQISLHLASIISNGGTWPDGGKAPQGHVIILSAEDGATDTTLPRLMACGADRYFVHAVRSVTDKGRERSFNLGADLKQLDELCAYLGDVVLVIIDPVTSYLGEIDSHRTSDVRAVLEPLGNWAEKARVSVLAISHPPKAAQAKAINAVTGSLAFVAAARVALVACADSETKGRSLLLSVKNNIAQAPKGLGYRIEGCTVEGSKGPIHTSLIAWDDKEVKVTADEAMSATRGANKPQEVMGDALAYLRDRLGFGAVVSASDMNEGAKAHCINESTLRRARKQHGVVASKTGYQGAWTWQIPDTGDVI